MVVLELGTRRRPHGQAMLQLVLAILYACAHLGQPGLAAQLLPLLSAGREARGAVGSADTREARLLPVVLIVDTAARLGGLLILWFETCLFHLL
jgi:hypothetical protein